MAILYTFLPHGDGISGWTRVRILLAVNVGLLAIARLREVSLVAVASIPFVGVVGRTGVIDRPVSEILLVAVVFALIMPRSSRGMCGLLQTPRAQIAFLCIAIKLKSTVLHMPIPLSS